MLLLAALWIGMSAQAQTQWASQPSSDCSFGELVTVGQNQVVAMCLGGKWVVADWVANAAQKKTEGSSDIGGDAQLASGETDGLTHCMKSDGTPCGAADETDGKPLIGEFRDGHMWNGLKWELVYPRTHSYRIEGTEQAIDVPAVQEPEESECGASWHHEEVSILCTNHGTPDLPKGTAAPLDRTIPGKDGYITTCSDKYRILLHDESNPAKFWCHKVQP